MLIRDNDNDHGVQNDIDDRIAGDLGSVNSSKQLQQSSCSDSWFRLENLVESYDGKQMENGIDHMSASWRLFLLGDGSPTRHLRLLTGRKTAVDVFDSTILDDDLNSTASPPAEISLIEGPRVRRQVWLQTSDGERLGYAVSWWCKSKMDVFLSNKAIPIGSTVASGKRELYRDIRQVFLGSNAVLEREFGFPGPFWGRYYVFYHEGNPLTLIYEVFSPALVKYLGNVETSNKID